MSSDLEIALAFIARRQATKAMSASRWSHMLSLEMGWMNPGQARAFVERAVRAGILAPDGELMRLVIDPTKVEVPRGFRPRAEAEAGTEGAAAPAVPPKSTASAPPGATAPTAAAAAAPPADPFLGWVAKVATARGLTRDQVLGQVAATQGEMGGLLTAEAAVLLLARRNGLDVAEAAATAAAALQAQPSR
ncbi:MAG: hypothetical protein QOC71_865 [Thermoplasmata archaeon]|jgi:hypothetical protein|nr:hypothetical protein [Thermoplasmata archaeon]